MKVKRKKANEIGLGGRSLSKKKTDLFYNRNDSCRDCSLDKSRKIKNEQNLLKIIILVRIYEYFSCCLHDPRTKDHIRGPRPASTVTFFRITWKISPFGTCHFKIIARNIKAIFMENFSSSRVDAGKIFEITTFIRGQGPHTGQ